MADRTIRARLLRNVSGQGGALSHGSIGVLERLDGEGGARVRVGGRRVTVRLHDLEVWSEERSAWEAPTPATLASVPIKLPHKRSRKTPNPTASTGRSDRADSPCVRLSLGYVDPQGVLKAGQLVEVATISGPQSARLRVGDRRVDVRTSQLEVWSTRLADWRPLTHDPYFAAAIEAAQKTASTAVTAPRPARASAPAARPVTVPHIERSTPRAPARSPWIAMIVLGIAVAIFAFTYIPAGPSGGGPDLDCRDIGHKVRVGSSDPNGLDRDGDGIGCEASGYQFAIIGWIAIGAIALGVVQLVRTNN